MKVAVVGSGISGNLIARLLSTQHDVDVYERQSHAGGHAQTVSFESYGRPLNADIGFMVYNERTYPNFCRMLTELDVASNESDMSFSVRCDRTGLAYQGSSLRGLFAQRRNLFRPAFYKMLGEIFRFNRVAREYVVANDDDSSLGEFLAQHRFRGSLIDNYLLPMSAAIWSADPADLPNFPAKFILGFFHNHGLLQIKDRPQWRSIAGGSAQYVNALIGPIRNRVHNDSPVTNIVRGSDRVHIEFKDRAAREYDQVVLACHADQSLQLLSDATRAERDVLQAFPYQENDAVLHTDRTSLPKQRDAWASWNYHIPATPSKRVSVTYDLNRLQKLGAPGPVCLSLNPNFAIDPESVVAKFKFQHPVFSETAVQAQARFLEVSGRHHRTHFCGAYWGYGFHEDGVNSALEVADHFGLSLQALSQPVRGNERTRVPASTGPHGR